MAKLVLGTKACQCAGCGEYFSTVSNFDKHRIFENADMPDWATRRCMSADEMLASGLVRNSGGYWGGQPRKDAQLWYQMVGAMTH